MQYDGSFCALFQYELVKIYNLQHITCNTTYKFAKTD